MELGIRVTPAALRDETPIESIDRTEGPAPKLLLLTGPSLGGTLEAAVALAQRFDGELIACNPYQAARHFDIGTDKPTLEELAGIPLHLTDFLEPDEALEPQGYAARAAPVVDALHARGKLPIVVVGSASWLTALTIDRPPPVSPDPRVALSLQRELEGLDPRALHAQLREIDPDEAHRIGRHDRRALLRALSLHQTTGAPPSVLRRAQSGHLRYDTWRAFLEVGHAEIHQLAEARFERRLARGWIEEGRRLLERYPDGSLFSRLNYGSLLSYLRPLRGPMTLGALRDQTTNSECWHAMGQHRAFKHAPDLLVRTRAEAMIRGDEDEAITRWRSTA